MGTVFRGWHEGRDEAVAVKVLSPRWVDNPVARGRFLSEARAMSRVDSPHIVKLRGFALRKGVPYMVMNLVRGRTLADRIEGGGLTLRHAFEALEAVARALMTIHDASIVHNDVKSSNVMLDEGGGVTLLDFGLARPFADACKLNPDEVSGTPMYMAPEIAAGRADRPNAASDVYALGVLAFEVFTGRMPFDDDSPERILDKHIHQPPPRLSAWARDLPAGLDALVADCLVKDPRDRTASAEAFSRRLAEIADPLR